MSRQSRRLICQTAHGSLSTNTVKPTQPVSVSKARPRASRSSSAVEGRRATDETQRPTTHRVRVPGEKTRKSEPSTQRSLRAQHPVEQNTVFTQSSPEDREVDKEQGHQPKDWNCNKVRPQSHSSSGSRTAGQVSPLDVGYLRGSGVLWKIARDVQVQTVQTTDRRQKFQASHSGRRGNPEPFQRNNSPTHNRTGHQ